MENPSPVLSTWLLTDLQQTRAISSQLALPARGSAATAELRRLFLELCTGSAVSGPVVRGLVVRQKRTTRIFASRGETVPKEGSYFL